ncbi:MAG: DHH family phosphoesterase [Bacillota bacterium]|nr:DHH family phosphoesterase [Bacillota bacterium]
MKTERPETGELLLQIKEKLEQADSVLLFPHVLMDGDALGSAAALCLALRRRGKQAEILLEDAVPANLRFLDRGLCTYESSLPAEPDVCMAVDCSDPGRFEKRQERFRAGKLRISIDHHVTNKGFADIDLVEPGAGATGEIVYRLLCAMGCPIDEETGLALYAAIATDTGNYQYSNTTKESHLITAALYDSGMDHTIANREIYQTVRPEKVKLTARTMAAMEFFCEGKGVVACVSQKDLKETGAWMEETEGLAEELRNICGVEISCLLKESETGAVKVSLRAKGSRNVAAVSAAFGGGGHPGAAGCTLKGPMEEAKGLIMKAIAGELESC